MKFLVEVRIPTESGNKGIMDGTLMQQMQSYLGEVKPETVYFALAHGKRTVYMVVNIPAAEKMVEIAEPLWLDWNAEVYATPVMDQAAFEKAGAGIERIVRARK